MKEFFKIIKNHLAKYPSPFSLNFNWSFGSLAGLFLIIQIVTGAFLTFYYIPHPESAFFSIERTIMRDVHNGWLIRYIHMNGASFFFFVVYIHMARSLYYRTYVGNKYAWCTGLILFILLIAVAFMGYVLPWSQMSYWAATVITNLFSSIPVVGPKIVYWIW
jgi:ubiquinol-cytochrome c reductase cytochrome b subunit